MFQSYLLTNSSTFKHKNNLRWLSDCFKFSFDIWRKKKHKKSSETKLTYRKLFHPLHLGTPRYPNLSKQRAQPSLRVLWHPATGHSEGRSSTFSSRGHTNSRVQAGAPSPLLHQKGSWGQAGAAPRPELTELTLLPLGPLGWEYTKKLPQQSVTAS